MMKVITRETLENMNVPKSVDICPSLILAKTVVCDAGSEFYEPSLFQVREYCTTIEHGRCPLRLPATSVQLSPV